MAGSLNPLSSRRRFLAVGIAAVTLLAAAGLIVWRPWRLPYAPCVTASDQAQCTTWSELTVTHPALSVQPHWLPAGITRQAVWFDPLPEQVSVLYSRPGHPMVLQVMEQPASNKMSVVGKQTVTSGASRYTITQTVIRLQGVRAEVATWKIPDPATVLSSVLFTWQGVQFEVIGEESLPVVERVAVSLMH
jgi:hypothetical protein